MTETPSSGDPTPYVEPQTAPAVQPRRRFDRAQVRTALLSGASVAVVVLVACAGFAVGRATAPDDHEPRIVQPGQPGPVPPGEGFRGPQD